MREVVMVTNVEEAVTTIIVDMHEATARVELQQGLPTGLWVWLELRTGMEVISFSHL